MRLRLRRFPAQSFAVMSSQVASNEVPCPACGQASGVALPVAASQPLLDALAFANPETLESSLRPSEVVLIMCRANVGGLVGTDRRLLVIKNGEAHEHSYQEVQDIVIENVGWLLDAVWQLVTPSTPYQSMKSKAADASPRALSLIRDYVPVFEAAKARILDLRDRRRCRSCGAFVPITPEELRHLNRSPLMEPIPNGGAQVLVHNLLPGERILCQAHGARFHKSIVVTDQRVLIVQGRGEKYAHIVQLAEIDGVDVHEGGLQLRLQGRPFERQQGMALVTSGTGVPGNEPDVPNFRVVAGVIAGLKAGG